MSTGHVILELQELRDRVETLHMKGSLVHPAVLKEVEVLCTSVQGLRDTLKSGLKAQQGEDTRREGERRGRRDGEQWWQDRRRDDLSSTVYTDEDDYSYTTEASSYYTKDYDTRTEDSYLFDDRERRAGGRLPSTYRDPYYDDSDRHDRRGREGYEEENVRGRRTVADERERYHEERIGRDGHSSDSAESGRYSHRRDDSWRRRGTRKSAPSYNARGSSPHSVSRGDEGRRDQSPTTETLQDVADFYQMSTDRLRSFNPQLRHLRDDDPLPEGTRVSIRPATSPANQSKPSSTSTPPARTKTPTPPADDRREQQQGPKSEITTTSTNVEENTPRATHQHESERRNQQRTPPPPSHLQNGSNDNQLAHSPRRPYDAATPRPAPESSRGEDLSVNRSRGRGAAPPPAAAGDHDSIRSIADATGTTPAALVKANKCLQGYHFHEPLPPNLQLDIPPPASGATIHHRYDDRGHSLSPPRDRGPTPTVDYTGSEKRKRTPNRVKRLPDMREIRVKPGTTLRDLERRYDCPADLICDLNSREIGHFPVEDELPVGLLLSLPYTEMK